MARAAPAAFLGSWALVGSIVGQRFLRSGLPFLVSVVSDDVDAGVLPFQVAPVGRLETASFSRHGSSLHPFRSWGGYQSRGFSLEVVGSDRHSSVGGSSC
jgi:hypothetical protein